MTTQKWIDDASFARTKQDDDQYHRWTDNLPAGTIGHCAAHSLHGFVRSFHIAQPKQILEIGFNRGHSAVMMLELGAHHITSVDVSDEPEAMEAVRIVKEKYGHRFHFIKCDSKSVAIEGQFDMIFIDGDHSYDGVLSDIRLGQKLGIKWFLFDDWQPRFASTQEAIATARLIPIAIFGNIALCIPEDGLIGVPVELVNDVFPGDKQT